jgi:hypothetical protein
MSSERPLRVTLTGDRAGDYVVVEEGSDGSLVVAPDRARFGSQPLRPQPQGLGALFSSFISRPPQAPSSVVAALRGWGVALCEDEPVRDFMAVTIDARSGFLALTSRRFIFIARSRAGLRVEREAPLFAAHDVELVRHRLRNQLRVKFHDDELLIRAPDRSSLVRLHRQLEDR